MRLQTVLRRIIAYSPRIGIYPGGLKLADVMGLSEKCPGATEPPQAVAAASGTRPRIRSAAFSAIIIVGACVFERVIVGITEASTTRSPSTP